MGKRGVQLPWKKKSSIEKLKTHEVVKHETKRKALFKFLGVLALVIVYWGYISYRYGTSLGSYVTLLTWSLFVLCTPIASAGLLVDFPVRLLTKMKMFHVEVMVWALALSINAFTIATYPSIYDATVLVSMLRFILTNPMPYWSIIFVSAAGTFISIRFADELMDVRHEKHRVYYLMHEGKHTLIVFAFVILAIVLAYSYIMQNFGINAPMF